MAPLRWTWATQPGLTVDDFLQRDDLDGAFRVASTPAFSDGADQAYQKIADYQIGRGHFEAADKTLCCIQKRSFKDLGYEQIFTIYLNTNDFEGAVEMAKKLGPERRQSAELKLLNSCMRLGDLSNAERIVLNSPTLSRSHFLKMILAEYEKVGNQKQAARLKAKIANMGSVPTTNWAKVAALVVAAALIGGCMALQSPVSMRKSFR